MILMRSYHVSLPIRATLASVFFAFAIPAAHIESAKLNEE